MFFTFFFNISFVCCVDRDDKDDIAAPHACAAAVDDDHDEANQVLHTDVKARQRNRYADDQSHADADVHFEMKPQCKAPLNMTSPDVVNKSQSFIFWFYYGFVHCVEIKIISAVGTMHFRLHQIKTMAL